jgi:hypothetical protein
MLDLQEYPAFVAELRYLKRKHHLNFRQIANASRNKDLDFSHICRICNNQIKKPHENKIKEIAFVVASIVADEFGEFQEQEDCPIIAELYNSMVHEMVEKETITKKNANWMKKKLEEDSADLQKNMREFQTKRFKVPSEIDNLPGNAASFYYCLNQCFRFKELADYERLHRLLFSYTDMDEELRKLFVDFSEFLVKRKPNEKIIETKRRKGKQPVFFSNRKVSQNKN